MVLCCIIFTARHKGKISKLRALPVQVPITTFASSSVNQHTISNSTKSLGLTPLFVNAQWFCENRKASSELPKSLTFLFMENILENYILFKLPQLWIMSNENSTQSIWGRLRKSSLKKNHYQRLTNYQGCHKTTGHSICHIVYSLQGPSCLLSTACVL